MRKLLLILTMIAAGLVTPPAMAEPPSNDDLAQAEDVTLPFSDVADTSEATVEVGEPILLCDYRPTLNTIWYRVSVDEDQRVFGDTVGSDFDTIVAVFEKEDPALTEPPTGFEGLRPILCEDRDREDLFAFNAEEGTTYYIQIGGHADHPSGSVAFNFKPQGKIGGLVTNELGEALEDICVYANPNSFRGYYDYFGYARSASDGTYEIDGLREGDYRISFYDCNYFDEIDYVFEFYNDKQDYDDADPVSVVSGQTTAGINAALAIRPPVVLDPADLAVTSLEIRNTPITTDHGDLGYSGYMREIEVSVANLGVNSTNGLLRVRVCPRTYGSCSNLRSEWFDAPTGSSRTFDIEWNAFGSAGDMEVTASVCITDYEHYDTDSSNDVKSAKYYALVGGTGFGVSPQLGPPGYGYGYGCGLVEIITPARPFPGI